MEVRAEDIAFLGHGGDELRAALFRPAEPHAARRGLVLVHEVFGLDAFTRSVGERLATEGYVVLAPDLYSREGLPGPAGSAADPAPEWSIDQIRAAVRGLPDRRVVSDLEAGVGVLCADPHVDEDRVGALGFCMGGNYAYLLGCHSRRVSAVVDFYGRIVYDDLSAEKPVQPLEMALNLTAPLLGIFAADDPSIPPEHVAQLEERLAAFAKAFRIRIFPGVGHGFFNPLRPARSDSAAREAWTETLAFLDDNLV